MQNFTPEDLLRYLYNETTASESTQIKAALESDWSLREKFEVITSAHKRLEMLNLSPRKDTVSNILNYAQKAIGELIPQA